MGVDEGTPVAESYNVPAKFTGTIDDVMIDLQEVKAADRDEVEGSDKMAVLKRGLSD